MDAPRLSVALTIDHDAISDSVRRGDSPVKFSHAEFGPRVGAKRLLAMLAQRGIPSTWFVPGHTLTTFTDDTDAILAGGHELACHGWFHEDFGELSVKEQQDVLGRSVEAVRAVTGTAPAGFRAPYWSLGEASIGLIEAAGFAYDSSLMANDYDLYRIRHGDRHSTTDGTTWGQPGTLVEVPVYWAMDDWPLLRAGHRPRRALGAVQVLEIWTEELRYAHAHAPGRAGHGHGASRSASGAVTGWRCWNGSSTRPPPSTASSSNDSMQWSAAGRRPISDVLSHQACLPTTISFRFASLIVLRHRGHHDRDSPFRSLVIGRSSSVGSCGATGGAVARQHGDRPRARRGPRRTSAGVRRPVYVFCWLT